MDSLKRGSDNKKKHEKQIETFNHCGLKNIFDVKMSQITILYYTCQLWPISPFGLVWFKVGKRLKGFLLIQIKSIIFHIMERLGHFSGLVCWHEELKMSEWSAEGIIFISRPDKLILIFQKRTFSNLEKLHFSIWTKTYRKCQNDQKKV